MRAGINARRHCANRDQLYFARSGVLLERFRQPCGRAPAALIAVHTVVRPDRKSTARPEKKLSEALVILCEFYGRTTVRFGIRLGLGVAIGPRANIKNQNLF
jgi:hypothetical protein